MVHGTGTPVRRPCRSRSSSARPAAPAVHARPRRPHPPGRARRVVCGSRPGRRRPPRRPTARPRRGGDLGVRAASAAPAAACSTETMVPGTVSPTDATHQPDRVSQCGANTAAVDLGEFPARLGRRRQRRRRAHAGSATDHAGVAARPVQRALRQRGGDGGHVAVRPAAESAAPHAARMVNSMFVPVSASATGNTLSRLISSV